MKRRRKQKVIKTNTIDYKPTTVFMDWLWNFQDGRCVYCFVKLEIEDCDNQGQAGHKIPLSRGGEYKPSNLVFSCRTCDSSKQDKLIKEWISV